MKYRCQVCKSNRIVEAVQITDKTFTDPHPNPEHVKGVVYDPIKQQVKIKFSGGFILGRLGDWIVTEATGEVSITKGPDFPTIFQPE